MTLPTINLEELKERKIQNTKERKAFTRNYAKRLREQTTTEQELHN